MNDKKLCLVCTNKYAQYSCPRCHLLYCSLECYKNHSTACTEKFYKAQVTNELQQQQQSQSHNDDVQNMVNILKRVHLDDNNNNPQHDHDDITMLLNEEEEKDFYEAVVDGRLAKYIEIYKPWWSKDVIVRPSVYISNVDNIWGMDGVIVDDTTIIPVLPPDNMNVDININASSLLKHNLVVIVYTYVVIMRVYNGDFVDEMMDEIIQSILHISCVLVHGDKTVFDCVNHAIMHCINKCDELSLLHHRNINDILNDALCIIYYRSNIARCLWHLHNIFSQKFHKSLKKICKKLVFYISILKHSITHDDCLYLGDQIQQYINIHNNNKT